MVCCACGSEALSMPTVRWRKGNRRFTLCNGCLDLPLRSFVWIVPGDHTVNARCRLCGSYSSLSEMATLSPGAGKRDFGGVCASCAG